MRGERAAAAAPRVWQPAARTHVRVGARRCVLLALALQRLAAGDVVHCARVVCAQHTHSELLLRMRATPGGGGQQGCVIFVPARLPLRECLCSKGTDIGSGRLVTCCCMLGPQQAHLVLTQAHLFHSPYPVRLVGHRRVAAVQRAQHRRHQRRCPWQRNNSARACCRLACAATRAAVCCGAACWPPDFIHWHCRRCRRCRHSCHLRRCRCRCRHCRRRRCCTRAGIACAARCKAIGATAAAAASAGCGVPIVGADREQHAHLEQRCVHFKHALARPCRIWGVLAQAPAGRCRDVQFPALASANHGLQECIPAKVERCANGTTPANL